MIDVVTFSLQMIGSGPRTVCRQHGHRFIHLPPTASSHTCFHLWLLLCALLFSVAPFVCVRVWAAFLWASFPRVYVWEEGKLVDLLV